MEFHYKTLSHRPCIQKKCITFTLYALHCVMCVRFRTFKKKENHLQFIGIDVLPSKN